VSSDVEAELERRLKAQYEPANAEKRSYSPAPSSTPSLHPTEKALRDAVWRFAREKTGTALVALLLGGGGAWAGGTARDTVQDAALRTAEKNLKKATTDLEDAAEEAAKQAKTIKALRSEVRDLDGAQKSLGEKLGRLREQVEKLEEAKTIVVKADPDRPPKP
jgi:uncharacterized protein HemX